MGGSTGQAAPPCCGGQRPQAALQRRLGRFIAVVRKRGPVAPHTLCSPLQPVPKLPRAVGNGAGGQARKCVSVRYNFFPAMRFGGRRLWRLAWGTAMDSTPLQALIAEVRGTAAALGETEKRVASFTAELAQQDHGAHPAQQTRTPVAKRGNSGWVRRLNGRPPPGIFKKRQNLNDSLLATAGIAAAWTASAFMVPVVRAFCTQGHAE